MQESLRRALATSPRLREAAAKYHEAGAAVEEARVLGRPDLRLTAQYGRNYPGYDMASPFGKLVLMPDEAYNVTATFRQPLWTGGRLHNAVKATKAAQAASLVGMERTSHDLQMDVRVAFQEVILADELIGVAREQLKLQQMQLDVSKAQYQAGAAARYNVLSAEANLSRAQQQMLEAQKARVLAADHLLTLIGLAPGQPIDVVASPLPDCPRGAVDEWVSLAVQRRPELRQLDLAIRAEEARRQLERCSSAPRLDLQVQRVQQTRTTFTLEQEVVAGLQLTIPLYDGGLSSARAAQAGFRVEALRAQREEARRNVVLQVRQVHTDLTNAFERLEVAERNVTQAREALRAANSRYRAGISVLVELQSTQASLVQALVSRSEAHFQCEAATARWLRAIADPTLETTPAEVRNR